MSNTVLCDFCGKDYTDSKALGGILFESKATCPKCVPRIEKQAEKYDETRFIRGRCPDGKTFADWVREDLR